MWTERRDEELAWFVENERQRELENARVEERNRLAAKAGERAVRTRFRREQRRKQRQVQTHELHLDDRWAKESEWWGRKYTSRCGATTRRDGHPCWWEPETGKTRCKFHGGKSTGPKTPEGRARIAEAQRKRWANSRSRNDDALIRD
jgi:hypothetical protein